MPRGFPRPLRSLDLAIGMIERRRDYLRRMRMHITSDPALNAYYKNADDEIKRLRLRGHLPSLL